MCKFKMFITLSIIFACVLSFSNIKSVYAIEYYDMYVGETLTLNPYSTSGKTLASYNWISNSPYDVEVVSGTSKSCTIRALKASGNDVVINFNYYYYITSGSYTYQAEGSDAFIITVSDIDAESISLTPAATVTEGNTVTLKPVITPSNATSTLSWVSGDGITATVSDSGVVTGCNPGTATITVSTSNGLSASCNVTVIARELSFLSSTPKNGAVNVNTDSSVIINYNTILYEGSSFDYIALTDSNSGQSVNINKSISDKTLTLTPASELIPGHSYEVTVPSNALKNQSGSPLSVGTALSFTTCPMKLSAISPSKGTGNVNIDCHIAADFNVDVCEGEAFSSIILTDSEGNAAAFTYGIEGKTLTIIPSEPLKYNSGYTLTIPVGALNNSYGITNNTEFSTTFTTRMSAYTPNLSNKLLGGSSYESINSIKAIDGGYIAVGSAGEAGFGSGIWENSAAKGDEDAVIFRLDNNYNIIWCRNFGGAGEDIFNGVTAISDGYVAVGYSGKDSFKTGDLSSVTTKIQYYYQKDAIIVKFDLEGNILWVKNYNGSYSFMQYNDVEADESDNLYVAGRRNGDIIGGYGLAIKYNSSGTKLWERSVGDASTYSDAENSLEDVLADGSNYIFVGENNKNPFIISYNSAGTVMLKKTLPTKNSADDRIYSIVKTYDGYAAAIKCKVNDLGDTIYSSLTGYGGYDGVVIGFDSSFNVKWTQNFGGSQNDALYSVEFNSGEIIAVGYEYNNGCANAMAVGISATGEPQWKKVYEGGASSLNYIVNKDGILTAAGYSYGAGTGDLANIIGFGSGDVLIVRIGDEPIQPMGDLDNSGTVDRIDASIALRYISGIGSLTETQLATADINCDGNINMIDVILMLQNT